jgi:hypothetical protein
MDRDEIEREREKKKRKRERVGEAMVYFRSNAFRICLSWSFYKRNNDKVTKKKRDAIRERYYFGEKE